MTRTLLAVILAAVMVAPSAAHAQGRGPKKEFVVAQSRAVIVTRDVLTRQGFVIIKIERVGNDQVVYYRTGNQGRGRSQGPPMKLIIRRVEDRVVFLDTPDAILVDINVRLKL